jgi:transcriptional regulator with XRE-family HTH domain
VADNELGLFLRSRRETITPAELGLPGGSRRRTPGLRRAEVASLAGVSVEYVTRLEQGRDRHPSAAILGALAGALRLSPSERVHLYRLSKGQDPGFTCRGGEPPSLTVRDPVRAVLLRLDPAAAVVTNHLGDLLAWTSDWDRMADDRVADLKQGPFRADPALAALADELTVTAGDAFDRRTHSVPGLPRAHGTHRWLHPAAGELRMAYETLTLPADDGQHLTVHLPADPATEDAWATRRPKTLRLVAG